MHKIFQLCLNMYLHRKKTRTVVIKISALSITTQPNHGNCFKAFFFWLFLLCKCHTVSMYYFYKQKKQRKSKMKISSEGGLGIMVRFYPKWLSRSTSGNQHRHSWGWYRYDPWDLISSYLRASWSHVFLRGLDGKMKPVELQNLQAFSCILSEPCRSLKTEASPSSWSPFDPQENRGVSRVRSQPTQGHTVRDPEPGL